MTFRTMLPAALLLALAACQDPAAPLPVATSASPAPAALARTLPTARWDSQPAGREWTRLALAGIETDGQGLIATQPTDVAAYCPSYTQADSADRRAFWVGLMSALTRFESNFKPDETFTEPNIVDRQGNRVISRGLLQISQESANGYGCQITDAQQLHDPATNLSCAARIMNRLVTRDGVIGSTSGPWKGMAAYWSPFRRADRRAEMQQWISGQSYCR